jgi:hypothetical protein
MSPATLSSSSSTARSPANPPPPPFRMKGTFTPTCRVKVPLHAFVVRGLTPLTQVALRAVLSVGTGLARQPAASTGDGGCHRTARYAPRSVRWAAASVVS